MRAIQWKRVTTDLGSRSGARRGQIFRRSNQLESVLMTGSPIGLVHPFCLIRADRQPPCVRTTRPASAGYSRNGRVARSLIRAGNDMVGIAEIGAVLRQFC